MVGIIMKASQIERRVEVIGYLGSFSGSIKKIVR